MYFSKNELKSLKVIFSKSDCDLIAHFLKEKETENDFDILIGDIDEDTESTKLRFSKGVDDR